MVQRTTPVHLRRKMPRDLAQYQPIKIKLNNLKKYQGPKNKYTILIHFPQQLKLN
jgi:hypothetical protein